MNLVARLLIPPHHCLQLSRILSHMTNFDNDDPHRRHILSLECTFAWTPGQVGLQPDISREKFVSVLQSHLNHI